MSNIISNLGPVSAYALAKKHGFAGTEEEWATLQAQAGTNAQKADESQKEALRYMNEANGYAQSASAAEKRASGSEINASSYADAARESERNARDSELNAKKSETNAEIKIKEASDAAAEDIKNRAAAGEFDGDPGVYVGPAPIPDGTHVQVEPDGEETVFLPDVLQETGTSILDVMSQKAVTDALEKKQGRGNYVKQEELPTKISQFENDLNYVNESLLESSLKTKVSLPKNGGGNPGQVPISDGKGGIIWINRDSTDWEYVQIIVQNNLAPTLYPVGYEFATHDSENNRDIIWVVRGHNHHKKAGAPDAPTMTLEMKEVFSSSGGGYKGVQFCASEALYYSEAGLPAGEYYFTVKEQAWFAEDNDKSYKFTLAKPLPAKGQIVVSMTYNQALEGKTITTYDTTKSLTEAIETTTLTAGNTGTNLGNTDGKSPGLNHLHRIAFGSNNYAQSAYRQFLNSAETAGAVWKPQTGFNRPPSWNSSQAGFLKGLPADFVNILATVELPCRTNSKFETNSLDGTAYAINQTYSLQDKIFVLSRPEIYGDYDSANLKDGTQLEFYKGTDNTDKIKYDGAGTAKWYWLRSPIPWVAYFERGVNTDGTLSYNGASYSLATAAACVIA